MSGQSMEIAQIGERRVRAIFGHDLEEINRHTIRSISPEYFNFELEMINYQLNHDEDSLHAALALRRLYFHTSEVLLSLLGAVAQTPNAIYCWLNEYQMSDLVYLSDSLQFEGKLPNAWLVEGGLSWESLANVIFGPTDFDGDRLKKQNVIKEGAVLGDSSNL